MIVIADIIPRAILSILITLIIVGLIGITSFFTSSNAIPRRESTMISVSN